MPLSSLRYPSIQALSEVEDKFQSAMGSSSMATFHPFMDYNAGLWTWDLDTVVEGLKRGGQKYTALKWPVGGESTMSCYSVIVNVCGFVNLEIMGNSLSVVPHTTLIDYPVPRLSMTTGFVPEKQSPPSWSPMKLSRATTNIDAVKTFYEALGATIIVDDTYDTMRVLELVLNSQANVHLQFWQHVEESSTSGQDSDDVWTVRKLPSTLTSPTLFDFTLLLAACRWRLLSFT